jgi:hypothetical protein
MESSIGGWKYQRFQKLLDVEVWVPDNKGVAYAASYARGSALKKGQIQSDEDVVNAVVIRYQNNHSVLRQLVRWARRLAQESGYVVEEDKLGGTRVLRVNGHGESWAVWAAKRHIIKVGGRGRDSVPGSVVKAYARRYPSRITSGILEGPLPPGRDESRKNDKKGKDPDDDFDTGPRPDWDKFKEGKPGGKK